MNDVEALREAARRSGVSVIKGIQRDRDPDPFGALLAALPEGWVLMRAHHYCTSCDTALHQTAEDGAQQVRERVLGWATADVELASLSSVRNSDSEYGYRVAQAEIRALLTDSEPDR